MKSWIKKHPIKAFFLLLLAVPFVLGALNVSGMCIAEGKWLSDEEQVELAINTAWRKPEWNYLYSVIPSGKEFDKFQANHEHIPYANVDEFKQKNPQCCRAVGAFSSGPYWPEFWHDYAFGFRAEVVEIVYTARFKDKHNNPVNLKNYTEYRVITNCGRVIVRY